MRGSMTDLKNWSVSSVSALILAAGCYYDNFSKVEEPEEEVPDGEGGDKGTGGDEMGGSENQGGADGTGGATEVDPITLPAINRVVTQGDDVVINLLSGLDDEVDFIEVEDVTQDVPTSLKAELASTNNGVLTFTPADDFWGIYRATYTVEDQGGHTVTGDISVIVIPKELSLSYLEDEGFGGFVVDGAAGDHLGSSLVGADMDGDGLSDLILGAPGEDTDPGRVVGVRGAERPTSLNLADDLAKVHVFSGTTDSGAGVSVAAGDLNGDDFADIVIGSARNSNGRVYAIFGDDGFDTPQSADLTDTPGATGFTLQGTGTTDAGYSLTLGNFGDDEKDDVLLMSRTSVRSVDVFFSPAADGVVAGADLHLEGSVSPPNRLIAPVAAVGDLLGDDGLSELLIASSLGITVLNSSSASGWPANLSMPVTGDQGWQGGATASNTERSVAAAGNFEGADAPTLAYCDGVANCLIVPFTDSATFLDEGWTVTGFSGVPRVFGKGNANGDEWDDLLFTDGTAGYVVWGRQSLPSADLNVTAIDEDGVAISTTSADPITRMAIVGDVNGDGVEDYAIGVPDYDGGKGRVYVVFGTPSSLD